ncbi:type II secretion system F family protein [Halorarius litoreus]|uniref:type II secretion system F family protein n=1 Tax=Halorarius litoreus TaxID=2962676 RepID=UPI0020CEBEEA|nr:type II secretion system F family protein [Halorarius litoreus]
MLEYVPLGLAVLILALLAVAPHSRRADRTVNRIAWGVFSGPATEHDGRRERNLRAAGIGTPYRLYVVKTYLYTAAGAFCGAVLGVYLGALIIEALNVTTITAPIARGIFRPLPDWLLSFSAKYFAVLLGASIVFGGFTASIVYFVRWQLPSIRADTRERQIEAGMPRMVAFVYALSRGGMAFPDVMRALARNRDVFGTAAEEMGVGVQNIELFGDDLVTAVRDLARRTPSDQFQKFAENLSSVLQSGQNLSAFLRDEYERYREAAEDQQRKILDLLATTAEVYVTVVVAGMLFLLTILLVIGLTSGGMLLLLKLISYAVLPATNILFVAYLSEITQPLRASRDSFEPTDPESTASDLVDTEALAVTDGGVVSEQSRLNLGRLDAYKRFRRAVNALSNPFEALVEQPTLVLYVTVPLAVGFVATQLPAVFSEGPFDVRVFDDLLIQSTLFVLVTFAIVHEIHRRKLEQLEEAVPDLLERLASLNEAGVSVVSSFDRVRRSDVGELDAEVERIWRDIQWGATVEAALERFEERVETPAVTRIVTLITNAMRASNEIGPVLRIAAEQARNDRRLKRQRRQEMVTYLVVIYVAFLVFLVVIAAIDFVLIPNLPTASETAAQTAAGAPTPGFITVTESEIQQYRIVFFHAAIIQATLSGLVGGQMGGGSLKDGVKHASVLLTIAYLAFLYAQEANPVAALLLPF